MQVTSCAIPVPGTCFSPNVCCSISLCSGHSHRRSMMRLWRKAWRVNMSLRWFSWQTFAAWSWNIWAEWGARRWMWRSRRGEEEKERRCRQLIRLRLRTRGWTWKIWSQNHGPADQGSLNPHVKMLRQQPPVKPKNRKKPEMKTWKSSQGIREPIHWWKCSWKIMVHWILRHPLQTVPHSWRSVWLGFPILDMFNSRLAVVKGETIWKNLAPYELLKQIPKHCEANRVLLKSFLLNLPSGGVSKAEKAIEQMAWAASKSLSCEDKEASEAKESMQKLGDFMKPPVLEMIK